MRIAIFTSQFPGRVNTFFARDVRALIDAGADVDVFPLHPRDDRHWDAVPACLGPDVLPRGRVHHVNLADALASQSTGQWSWRAAAADFTTTSLSAVRFGAVPLSKTAYAVVKAIAWARGHAREYDQVLAYWGNYAATAAYVFHRLTSRSARFSVFLHAGTDLYRDQVFLREKLLHADNVIVVCEFNRRFLHQLYPDLGPDLDRKVWLHHLALDLEEYAFDAGGRPPMTLLGVGSLEPAKGFDDLVRAAALLVSRRVPCYVRLVGDGRLRSQLHRLAGQLGVADRVEFVGWQTPDQARQAIREATVLVHPSAGLGDAVPTVIKEALALGTPVVASDVAGIPELLDGGRAGLLVPCRNTERLAAAIERLLADEALRLQFARAGRLHAETMFDIRRNGPRLAAMLRGTPGTRGDAMVAAVQTLA